MTTTKPKPKPKPKVIGLERKIKRALAKSREASFPDAASIHDPVAPFDSNVDDHTHSTLLLTPYSADEPWGQMGGENNDQFRAFCIYLAQGLSRTKSETIRRSGHSTKAIYAWHGKNNWESRVRAWDMFRERLYQIELAQETKKMAQEHGRIAAQGIMVLSSAFDELVRRRDEEPDLYAEELKDITTQGLLSIATSSARVIPNLMNAERLSRGMPTELTAHLVREETRITLQTSDDLAQLIGEFLGLTARPGVIDVEPIDGAQDQGGLALGDGSGDPEEGAYSPSD